MNDKPSPEESSRDLSGRNWFKPAKSGDYLIDIIILVDGSTESVLAATAVRQAMSDQLGCDPDGWTEHSSSKTTKSFDIESVIQDHTKK